MSYCILLHQFQARNVPQRGAAATPASPVADGAAPRPDVDDDPIGASRMQRRAGWLRVWGLGFGASRMQRRAGWLRVWGVGCGV
jgi:hypothetical protein